MTRDRKRKKSGEGHGTVWEIQAHMQAVASDSQERQVYRLQFIVLSFPFSYIKEGKAICRKRTMVPVWGDFFQAETLLKSKSIFKTVYSLNSTYLKKNHVHSSSKT